MEQSSGRVLRPRKAKTTELKPTPVVPARAPKRAAPQGSGISLGQIESFRANFSKLGEDACKKLHRILYGSDGQQAQRRNKVRKFCGSSDIEGLKKRIAAVKQVSLLKEIAGLFGMHRNKSKDDYVEILSAFFSKPKDEGKPPAKKRKTVAKAPVVTKTRTSTKVGGVAKPKEPRTSFEMFSYEERYELEKGLTIAQQTHELAELWKLMTNQDRAPYIEQSIA